MHTYIHQVKYYETDKMGITHHSNYIRWMEEARMDYLKSAGYGMKTLEEKGFTSPVVSLECRYSQPTTFDDAIKIEVSLVNYTGVKLEMSYIMSELETGRMVFTASSVHCFIGGDGRPIAVKKFFPEFDAALRELLGK